MHGSERVQVLEFLKNHVIGRSVVTAPVTTHTHGGQLTSIYEEDSVFSGLAETANGFSFDMTVLARGTRYRPEKDGALAEATLNAVRVLRYEMTERLSSGKLLGYARFVSTTNSQPDPMSGTVFLVRMWVDGRSLVLHESHVGYVDSISPDGSIRPFAIDGKATFVVEQKLLVARYEQETFDVDPQTLARKPTGDKFPVQVSREVQFPAPLASA